MKQFDWNVGAAACRTSPITSLTVPQHVLATVPSTEKPLPSGVCTLEYSAYVPPPPANAEISTRWTVVRHSSSGQQVRRRIDIAHNAGVFDVDPRHPFEIALDQRAGTGIADERRECVAMPTREANGMAALAAIRRRGNISA